ncbi:GYD domain-containing protein [Candidatus Bathyarchaeota archaeon]|nr:GYD domain-containing protein [Candidatus Bathyarchaeota archaeon]
MGVKFLPIFVVLGNWTEQGIKNVKDAPNRAKVAKDMVEKAGGKMQTLYTLGKCDFVSIIELPKEDDVMAILLCLGSMGNVRTITMKAWSESQVAKMLATPHP